MDLISYVKTGLKNKRTYITYVSTVCLLGFLIVLYVFHPGYLSPDSLNQLQQAIHGSYSEWHPPLMAIIWSYTISFTHSYSILLYIFDILLWISLWIMGCWAFRHRPGSPLAYIIPLLGFTPFIFFLVGVIWKDVFSGLLLFFLIAVSTAFDSLSKDSFKRYRFFVLAFGMLLLTVATSIRYNLLPAIVILTVWLMNKYALRTRLNFRKFSTFIFVFGVMVLMSSLIYVENLGISKIYEVKKDHPNVVVYVDDITMLPNNDEVIGASPLDSSSKDLLQNIDNKCKTFTVSRIFCLNDISSQNAAKKLQYSQYQNIQGTWLHAVAEDPTSVATNHLKNGWMFMIDGGLYNWYPGMATGAPSRVTNSAGLSFLSKYVYYTSRDFGFIFRPIFWLVISIIIILRARRFAVEQATDIILIEIASITYIFSYFLVMQGFDYRYIYPSVLMTIMGAILCIGKSNTRIHGRKSKNIKRA